MTINSQTPIRRKEVHIAYFSSNLPKHGIRVPRLNYVGASLRAYAETDDEVRRNYEFARLWDGRASADEVLDALDDPFMFAFSCYVFNFEWSMHIARSVKEAFPSCMIVVGGPHVPNIPNDFFRKHPYVDVIVHGEGEITFQSIFKEFLNPAPDFANVKGISYHKFLVPITNERGDNLPKVIDTPSAWTSGYLDDAIEAYRQRGEPIDVLWETNRGCPFACTFCYWGTLETNKLRQITMERLEAEIKYFADKKVDLIWICDANFGILPRDLQIAEMLADYKVKTGYPAFISANHTKRTNQTVLDIIKLQRGIGQMYGGVWMARQSMNENVLEAIKRPFSKNMAEEAKEWKTKFEAEGSPIKVDLILGLPEETKQSWFHGLAELFGDGFHDGVFVHYLSLLPNTPLADQVELHQLRIVSKPFRLMVKHSEKSDIVVGTRTMPTEDWIVCGAMSQLMLGMHIRGTFTRYLSKYLHQEKGFSFERFYVGLLEYALKYPDTFVGRLLGVFTSSHRRFANPEIPSSMSDSIGEYLPPGMGELFHKVPVVFEQMCKIKEDREVGFAQDQFIQMAILSNLDEFYRNVHDMVAELVPEVLDAQALEVLRFQQDLMPAVAEQMQESKIINYTYDWNQFFFGSGELTQRLTKLSFVDDAIKIKNESYSQHLENLDPVSQANAIKYRRAIFARVGASWFERGDSSITFSHSSQDGKTISMIRADRGSA
ncbi:B12-binding domain-containing radical SAM protein [Massilia sp. erpn]|uniref:B12-binding domain-containing radical SAM protein n=1 Tax=Massilia sp. erpn TaxID=2738142 RepID=UPI002102D2D0|nr:radical SAM protein [Massilia sp. erpn]UTY57070.1 radical SAM protein [Massilia sp. erpn]